MAKKSVVIADRASNSLQRVVRQLKSTSLIGAEDARTAILNHIRKLSVNYNSGSKPADFATLDGEFRSSMIWNYIVYFKVEDNRLVVLDIILEK